MNEFRLFIGFFVESLKSVPKNPTAILFGILLTLGSAEFLSSLFESGAPLERYRSDITSILETNSSILLLVVLIILGVAAFAKGGLILALSEKTPEIRDIAKKSRRLFLKFYMLEALFLLSVSAILVALLLPAILTRDTPALGMNLAFLGLAIFLPLFLTLIFVEGYAFFYLALSGTSLRASIELGYNLFMKRVATSVLFGTVSILILLMISVIIGILLGIMNTITPDSITRTVFAVLFLLIMQTLFIVIQNGAWLSFFRFIATTREEETLTSQKEENMVQKEIPETC